MIYLYHKGENYDRVYIALNVTVKSNKIFLITMNQIQIIIFKCIQRLYPFWRELEGIDHPQSCKFPGRVIIVTVNSLLVYVKS